MTTLLASTPAPGMNWEPQSATARPFVFSPGVGATVAVGDLMHWDFSNASTRSYTIGMEPQLPAAFTLYTHTGRVVRVVGLFGPVTQTVDISAYQVSNAELVITVVGPLKGIEAGARFDVASHTDLNEIVLAGEGLGLINDGAINWAGEITHPLDGRHPLNFFRPMAAAATTDAEKRMVLGVAQEPITMPPVADLAGTVLPRLTLMFSGQTGVLCDANVVAGDFLQPSAGTASTATRLTAPGAADDTTPVIGKALEDAPSGGGVTECHFEGLYGMGTTGVPY